MRVYVKETDKCLVEDDTFRSYVEQYASNKTLFFIDYAEVCHTILPSCDYATVPYFCFVITVWYVCMSFTLTQAHSKMSNLGSKFEPEQGVSFYTQDGYPNFDEH